jgi:uncharacterized protein YpmS
VKERKHKWLRRTLLAVAVVVTVVIGGALVALWLVRAEPTFYRPVELTAEQREAAAQRATNKLATIQNQAARLHAASNTRPVSPDEITVSFTADELNSFFDKWSNFQNWKASYQPYLDDPVVILQDGRIIFAGRVKELNLVASIHFEPKIDENGQLDLELVRVLGGRLPLPESMIGTYKDRLVASLRQKLPMWQASAAIDANGAANPSAIAASATKLLFHVLNHEPTEPVLYLPVMAQKGSVPVRISDVRIEAQTLTLRVRPMTRQQQVALIERIRAGDQQGVANASSER